ncbi:Leucyl aminopeptidase (aminopeptidase T) [Desulfurella amilsii]|uniref:Leucyl aminopeptidase (Aminopeptidase T) n=1 Tax=Desulfurella amilsii TaxID=1562698 RepID=A0A1X4XYN6_9BACT|nr:aminopeptidase [Desulfurella amilsii]OSS42647.1 Leucyl aminopeptidase (aminopeptidase T) [Desulfurella amilsii]
MNNQANQIIRKILKNNMGLKPNERCLVFTDLLNEEVDEKQKLRRKKLPLIAKAFFEEASSIAKALYFEYLSLGSPANEPPFELWEIAFGKPCTKEFEHLKGKILAKTLSNEEKIFIESAVKQKNESVDVVVALPNYSTSHTFFRKLLTNTCGARFASMPLFDEDMLFGPLSIDLEGLKDNTLRVYEVVKGANIIKINAKNATQIEFNIEGREFLADYGLLDKPGSFGNLPAGEVFIAPNEGKTNGYFVAEFGPTFKFNNNLCFVIKDGYVREIIGSDNYAHTLEGIIKKYPQAANIAELGIGTNKKAKDPLNILEAEKIYKTIHMALGDNSSFGGEVCVPFHQDFVLFEPNVIIIKDNKSEYLNFD